MDCQRFLFGFLMLEILLSSKRKPTCLCFLDRPWSFKEKNSLLGAHVGMWECTYDHLYFSLVWPESWGSAWLSARRSKGKLKLRQCFSVAWWRPQQCSDLRYLEGKLHALCLRWLDGVKVLFHWHMIETSTMSWLNPLWKKVLICTCSCLLVWPACCWMSRVFSTSLCFLFLFAMPHLYFRGEWSGSYARCVGDNNSDGALTMAAVREKPWCIQNLDAYKALTPCLFVCLCSNLPVPTRS